MPKQLAKWPSIETMPAEGADAELADGALTELARVARESSIAMGPYAAKMSFHVVDLAQHDVMLGCPWLEANSPHIDWKAKKMLVAHSGSPAVITEEEAPDPSFLISGKQLSRMLKKNSSAFCLVARRAQKGERKSVDMPKAAQSALDELRELRKKKLPQGLPPSRRLDHHIRLKPESEPAPRPICKLSERERQELREQLTELLVKGLIRPSASPWGAPALFAPKPNGGLRMRIDYRALNRMTIRSQLPLPLPDEIFEQLDGAAALS